MPQEYERPELKSAKDALLRAAQELKGKLGRDLVDTFSMLPPEAQELFRRLVVPSPAESKGTQPSIAEPPKPALPEVRLEKSWSPSNYIHGLRGKSLEVSKLRTTSNVIEAWQTYFKTIGEQDGFVPVIERLTGREEMCLVVTVSGSNEAIIIPLAFQIKQQYDGGISTFYKRECKEGDGERGDVIYFNPEAPMVVKRGAVATKANNRWVSKTTGLLRGD